MKLETILTKPLEVFVSKCVGYTCLVLAVIFVICVVTSAWLHFQITIISIYIHFDSSTPTMKRMKVKGHRFTGKKPIKQEVDHAKLHELAAEFDWSKFDNFKDIPISTKTKIGLRKSGYFKPTEIQRQSIGYALCGNDILGAAKTGSGKTLAFLIPMLECLYKNQWTSFDGLGALIISPTRELSYQIFEVLNKVGCQHDFSVGLIIGGKDLKFESKRMDRCNIVVCTPGRLLQHMDENPLFNCDNLKMLILDEADRILDLGFAKTMNAIIQNLPTERQTLLFSATQTKSIKDLARLSLKNPVYVSSHENEKYSTPENLSQSYLICPLEDKINLLWSFIKQHTKHKIIVFMSSCKQVKFVYELFCHMRPGIPLLALYGSLHQMKRMSIYDKFCQTSRTVLFATDIASRGLDFPSVNWVVQLDCPEDVNTYIHRVGRTARFEKGGESLLVLLPSEQECMLKLLSEKKVPIERIAVNPKKVTTIQRKAEAYLARDVALKETAQRAFKAYLKNVFFMKNKEIFRLDQLNLDAFSRSFGLVITPRVRFIERKLNNSTKDNKRDEPANLSNDLNDSSETSLSTLKNFDRKTASKSETSIQSLNDNDNESDEDLFQVKKVWRFDQDEDSSTAKGDSHFVDPLPRASSKCSKPRSKFAEAKRILKKDLKVNTKIVFDEDGGRQVFTGGLKQQSIVHELDNTESGIDLEISKKIMQEEDKVDKQMYRELLKEKHREKKKKINSKKEGKKSTGKDIKDDEELALTDFFIDALPDPDRIYHAKEDSENGIFRENDQAIDDDQSSNDDDALQASNTNISINVIEGKRKLMEADKESDESDSDSDTQTKKKKNVNYLEEIALKLLNH